MNYILLIVALMLSAVAAWYSIAGLVAIFAAAVVPIILMGGTLEVAKLVVASWLYRNWSEAPALLKTYFSIALVILMTLTSMGIFGFLSKAHLDQAVPTGDVVSKVELIEDKIKVEKENINEYRKILSQLDSQVDQTIARTANQTTDKGIRRSLSIRKNQAEERKDLRSKVENAQKEIARLNLELQPVKAELRKVEAEVGPVKYIAALIYGESADQTILEKAVRIVILMIVSVFDPLAVLMLVAANWSMQRKKEPWDSFFSEGKELAKAIDNNDGMFPKDRDMSYYSDSKWTPEELKQSEDDYVVDQAYDEYKSMEQEFKGLETAFDEPKHAYLEQDWQWMPSTPPKEQPKTLGRYLQRLAEQNAKLKNTTIEEEVEKLQK